MLAPLANVRCNHKMDRFLIKKGQKTADKPDGQTHRAVKNREEKESEENQHEDAEEGTSSQTAGVQSKKRKVRSIQDEHRKFQDKWTDEFLFVLHSMNPLCLLCKETRACFKRSNLERHFKTAHPKFNESYPPGSELRKRKIAQLTASLCEQQKLIHRTTSTAARLTEASFEIAWILARAKKPFSDSEIVKDCFLASAEILFTDFDNKDAIFKQIKGLQLSDSTIMRRMEDIGKDIRDQLLADLRAAPCFSIAVDESTDVTDVAQLCLWVRFPKENSFQEEMLCLLPLHGQTRGEDILNALLVFFEENHLSWSKLASVCTDGAPSMRGKEKGLVGLMKKRDEMPNFISFHCIIHQEALVSKLRNNEFQNVMQRVVHVVNYIVSRALNHRQFRQLIQDYDTEYSDLVLHSEVRWLSRGKVLERFLSLLPEINTFLDSKGKHQPELKDPHWIIQLALLTDITCHLNSLNLQLQGRDKLPSDMMRAVRAFQNKITGLWIPDRELIHFPKLRATTTSDPSLQQHFSYTGFVEVLEELKGEFESRFSDVTEHKDIFNFIENPFHVDVSSLTPTITQLCPGNRAALESEIIELQTNTILQVELRAGVGHFWSLVSEADFPTLKPLAQKVMSFFMSTYTCESTFSTMNTIKRKQRNRLTHAHLECLTVIATTNYKYNIKKVKDMHASFRSSQY